MEGKWLSILEYASYKKKSISTVRRYIKANRVKYKEDTGKYYIWVKNYVPSHTKQEKEKLNLKFELERLKKENIEIKEELAEAKMLISLYEKGQGLNHKTSLDLPELPSNI
ncbi:MAG: hypothetical protein QF441_15050 [Bacteriovoracaceae bacterium]|jgi:hypothetical protein|nr:hypothetical protein [Halobacteriovoraceae bacterium]MDP7321923.1 hypothetical protein [Bacteriovoracaceae bacterium]